jgi:hypothetical protein
MERSDLTASVRQLTATRPDLVKGVMLWSQGDGLMGCLMDGERRPIMASVPSAPHTDPATLFAHLDQVRGYLERRAG